MIKLRDPASNIKIWSRVQLLCVASNDGQKVYDLIAPTKEAQLEPTPTRRGVVVRKFFKSGRLLEVPDTVPQSRKISRAFAG